MKNTLDDWIVNRLTTLLSISSNDEIELIRKIVEEETNYDNQPQKEDTLVEKD